jgi:hypothetical protein
METPNQAEKDAANPGTVVGPEIPKRAENNDDEATQGPKGEAS